MNQEEINLLTQFRVDNNILWAGTSILKQELDKDNTEGLTTFIDRPVQFPLPEIKSMFPMNEAIALANYLSSSEGIGVRFYLDGLENPDINHPTFGELLGFLSTVANVISMNSVLNILNLGKRLKTKSEVLIGRVLSIEEITEYLRNWENING